MPTLKTAAAYSLEELSSLFQACFDGYFVPVAATPPDLAARNRMEDIDLYASQVIVDGDQPVGIAMIAIRGPRCRLAGFGLIESHRRKGIGKWAMEALVAQSKARGEDRMILECIGQNEAGLALYSGLGFKRMRRLVGYNRPPFDPFPIKADPGSLSDMVRAVVLEGEQNLPWQIDPATIAACGPNFKAYTMEGAWVLLAESPTSISVRSILVPRAGRGRGLGTLLLRAACANYPPKDIIVPSIMPEGPIAVWYGRNGFSPAEIWQYEMERVY